MKHISDHSASNHKIQVVLQLISLRQNAGDLPGTPGNLSSQTKLLEVFRSVLKESNELIIARPGHESLWYHRRSLVEALFDSIGKAGLLSARSCLVEEASWNARSGYFKENVVSCTVADTITATDCFIDAALAAFTSLAHTVDKEPPNILSQGDELLRCWLLSETVFLSVATIKNDMWDYKDQILLAGNYLYFSLSRVS